MTKSCKVDPRVGSCKVMRVGIVCMHACRTNCVRPSFGVSRVSTIIANYCAISSQSPRSTFSVLGTFPDPLSSGTKKRIRIFAGTQQFCRRYDFGEISRCRNCQNEAFSRRFSLVCNSCNLFFGKAHCIRLQEGARRQALRRTALHGRR